MSLKILSSSPTRPRKKKRNSAQRDGDNHQKRRRSEVIIVQSKKSKSKIYNNPYDVSSGSEIFSARRKLKNKLELEKNFKMTLPLHERGMKSRFSIDYLTVSKNGKELKKKKRESFLIKKKKSKEFVLRNIVKISDHLNLQNYLNFQIGSSKYDFINKRRNTFHIQLSIDMKKKEKKRLKNLVTQNFKRLRKEENQFLEGLNKFEEYITKGDLKNVKIKKLLFSEINKKVELQKKIHAKKILVNKIKNDLHFLEKWIENCKKFSKFIKIVLLEKEKKYKPLENSKEKEEKEEDYLIDISNLQPIDLISNLQDIENYNLFLMKENLSLEEEITVSNNERDKYYQEINKIIKNLSKKKKKYTKLVKKMKNRIEQNEKNNSNYNNDNFRNTEQLKNQVSRLKKKIQKICLKLSKKNSKGNDNSIKEEEIMHSNLVSLLEYMDSKFEKYSTNLEIFSKVKENRILVENTEKTIIKEKKEKKNEKKEKKRQMKKLIFMEREKKVYQKLKKQIKRKKIMLRTKPISRKSKNRVKKQEKNDDFEELFGM